MPWTCIRCESVNIDSDDTCEVCDERRGLNLPQQRQSIAAGGRHSLAITATGTVVAWGDSEYGKTRIPKNLCDVVAVAAGWNHSLALTKNGKVIEWGRLKWKYSFPEHLNNNIVSIVACDDYSMALRADGTVIAWGDNDDAQCDIATTLNSVIAIAAGWGHLMVLHANGTVTAWGENDVGQCDVPNYLTDVTAIAAGANYSYALTKTGKLFMWGGHSNSWNAPNVTSIVARKFELLAITRDKTVISCFRQNDDKNIQKGSHNEFPQGLHNIIELASSDRHNLVRKDDGTIYAWGSNNYMQCTVPSLFTQSSYARSTIAAGDKHSLAITATGTVVGWGRNAHGQTDTPEDVNVISVAAGTLHSLALTTNGKVVEWGYTNWDIELPEHLNYNVVSIAAGDFHSLALRADGTVFAWGDDEDICDVPQTLHSVIAIAAGADHSLALRADGTVVAWGNNDDGQCDVPDDLTNVIAIAAGPSYSYALIDTETLSYALTYPETFVTWGLDEESANIPDAIAIAASEFHYLVLTKDKTVITSDTDEHPIPDGLRDVVEIAVGKSHYLARQSDGTIIAWGHNDDGQCDVPSLHPQSSYLRSTIAAGDSHSLAITETGTVIGWGNNSHGQIAIPEDLHDVISVAAGTMHSLALTSTGTVVEWGLTSWHTDLPEELNHNVVSIAAGNFHSVALRADGTVFVWGDDDHNQCDIPATLNSVISIAAGDIHSLALRADGTVVGWGANEYGQSTAPHNLTNVIDIAAGYAVSFALTKSGEIVIWGMKPKSIALPEAVTIATKRFQFLALTKDKQAVALRDYELHDVAEIAAGAFHNMVRKTDGSIFAWGNNEHQQCIIPPVFSKTQLFKAMACTADQSIAVTQFGRVAIGDSSLHLLDNPTGVSQVAIGTTYALALCGFEAIYIWQHGDEESTLSYFPIPHAVAVAAGGEQYYALIADGSVVEILFDEGKPQNVKPLPELTDIRAIAVGSDHALALTSLGTVIAWGDDDSEQCEVPSKLDSVIAVAAGDTHSLALRADGKVVAWGDDSYSQCQFPKNLRNVTAIAAGDTFSVVLTADGTVQMFGNYTPELPSKAGRVAAIAATYEKVMYLFDNGTIEICQFGA